MTKSKEYVEQIKYKLDDVASREQLLIQALGEALSVADRKLLDDVRSLTVEHETRRALILSELQTLAARLGTFPATAPPLESIEHEVPDLPFEPDGAERDLAAPSHVPARPRASQALEPESAGGDWRKALENIRSGAGLSVPAVPKAG